MKNLVLISLVTLLLCSCNSSPTTSSSTMTSSSPAASSAKPNKLTKENVQRAVDQAYASALNWTEGDIIVVGGSAVVEGIQEQGNSADVDVRYVNTRVGYRMYGARNAGPVTRGTAQLVHYNDGRWVLKKLVLDPFVASVDTSIEIR